MIIETSIIIFVIVQTILSIMKKNEAFKRYNYERYKLIDIINTNIDDENTYDNIIKLISYYNYEGHILLTRVKNDLIRNKQFRLNKQLFDKIRNSSDRNMIKIEIASINNRMHIYKYKLNNIFIRLKSEINININLTKT
jgi:hypothetical protein